MAKIRIMGFGDVGDLMREAVAPTCESAASPSLFPKEKENEITRALDLITQLVCVPPDEFRGTDNARVCAELTALIHNMKEGGK